VISEPTYTSTGSPSSSAAIDGITNADNPTIIWILVSVTIIGIVYSTDRNKIRLVFEAVLSDRELNQNIKDKTSFTSRSTILLFVNYVLCFSLLSLSANKVLSVTNLSALQLASIAAGTITLLFIVKRIFLHLSGVVTGLHNEIQDYLFNHTIYTLAAGVTILPIVIMLNFTLRENEIFFQATFVFLLLFIVLRVVKSATLALKHRVSSLYYLFLYICTLEILPLIVFYKAFISKIA
jgi:hypothetical protein